MVCGWFAPGTASAQQAWAASAARGAPASGLPLPAGLQTCHRLPQPVRLRRTRVSSGADRQGDGVLSEDVLERLRAAEAEAAALRQQLAAAKAATKDGADTQPAPQSRGGGRVDGGDLRRELPFRGGGEASWLTEANVGGLLSRAGPSEAAQPGQSADVQGTVRRRLLLGGGLAAAAVALALVPDAKLRGRPSKPLFFFLVPLVRIQALLEQAEPLAQDGLYDELKALLARIQGDPNNFKQNITEAIACLTDEKLQAKAQGIAALLTDYIDQADYNRYFESMRTSSKSGKELALYADFSLKSIKAAEAKMAQFLALMPTEDLQAAQQQASAALF